MRAKIADLSMALEGRFGERHALMCRLHLHHTSIRHLADAVAISRDSGTGPGGWHRLDDSVPV